VLGTVIPGNLTTKFIPTVFSGTVLHAGKHSVQQKIEYSIAVHVSKQHLT
jgi:hypothetical protein